MKTIIILPVLFLFSFATYATSQFSDILIWNGETLMLFTNPLDSLPDWKNYDKIIRQEIENEDRKLNPEKYEKEHESLWSTACLRGYVAEWKIIDDKIYLCNIYSCHNNLKINLHSVFPGKLQDDIMFASWIQGELRVPQGKCLEWINLDYLSIYEQECSLQFTNGQLIDTVLYHNYIVKESRFSLDPNPNNLLEFIYSNIIWEDLPNMENDHFQVVIGVQPNIRGEIDSIIWNNTHCFSKSGFQFNKDNAFIKEAIRIAYLIPEWDVIVQRGRIVPRALSLLFDVNQRKKYTR